jgi:hypothetical protein
LACWNLARLIHHLRGDGVFGCERARFSAPAARISSGHDRRV